MPENTGGRRSAQNSTSPCARIAAEISKIYLYLRLQIQAVTSDELRSDGQV